MLPNAKFVQIVLNQVGRKGEDKTIPLVGSAIAISQLIQREISCTGGKNTGCSFQAVRQPYN